MPTLSFATLACSLLIGTVAGAEPDDGSLRLRSSAESGDLRAMRELAASLLNEAEVQGDEAVYWLEEASALGDAESMHRLASLRFAGASAEQDKSAAVALWQAASVMGHTDAMYDLAVCYRDGHGTRQSAIRASLWFKNAAKAGRPEAMTAWGQCLFDGTVVIQVHDQCILGKFLGEHIFTYFLNLLRYF